MKKTKAVLDKKSILVGLILGLFMGLMTVRMSNAGGLGRSIVGQAPVTNVVTQAGVEFLADQILNN
ncbi:MAG: hypothetical protein AAB373_06765 [Patescibacteria group bacterium]